MSQANKNLLTLANLKVVAGPVDGNTAAITGSRVNMKEQTRVSFVFMCGSSTSATAVELALKQHDAASSGNTKELAITNAYYHKIGAATSFTKVAVDTAEDTFDLLSLVGDSAAVVVMDVLAEDLDRANGYAWVSVNIADTGAAKLVTCLAVAHGLRLEPGYDQAI